jgi:hypothetical protein
VNILFWILVIINVIILVGIGDYRIMAIDEYSIVDIGDY